MIFSRCKFVVLLLLCVCAFTLAHNESSSDGTDVCSCSFSVPMVNETGCRVYGHIPSQDGHDELEAWYAGNESCLRSMEAAINDTLDFPFDAYLDMCPYPNGTDFSAAGFAALAQNPQYNNTLTIQLIFSAYPAFFEKPDNGSSYELRPNITKKRNNDLIDCAETASFCWSEIEFELTSDAMEAGYICHVAYNHTKENMENQQAVLREALCELSSDARPTSCEPLVSQIEQVLSSHSGLTCSDLTHSSMNMAIPAACTGPVDSPEAAGGTKSNSARLQSFSWTSIATILALTIFGKVFF